MVRSFKYRSHTNVPNYRQQSSREQFRNGFLNSLPMRVTMYGDKGILHVLFNRIYFFRSTQRFRWIIEIIL